MIFTHLPDSATWQLLATLVTAAAYQRWPYVTPSWFQLANAASLQQSFDASKVALIRLPALETAKVASDKVQLVEAPLQDKLVAGKPVRFAFLAPADVELSIEPASSAVLLKPSGLYQQITITPTADFLNVTAWQKWDTTFLCSLHYEVVPSPLHPRRSPPSRQQAIPANNLIYRRR